MTRRQWRGLLVIGGLGFLGLAVALVLIALEESIVFFYSPSELEVREVEPGQRIRVGGLVVDGSLTKEEDGQVYFDLTDGVTSLHVSYAGALPDLFREGQGVVAEGALGPENDFIASIILAKHDESYMPPEVADAIKDAGRWQHTEEPLQGAPVEESKPES